MAHRPEVRRGASCKHNRAKPADSQGEHTWDLSLPSCPQQSPCATDQGVPDLGFLLGKGLTGERTKREGFEIKPALGSQSHT